MKKLISLFVCAFLALILTYISLQLNQNFKPLTEVKSLDSIINQKIKTISKQAIKHQKIYYKGQLLGYITDENKITELLNKKYQTKFSSVYPNTKIELGENYYYVTSYEFFTLEDVDDQILDFINQKDEYSLESFRIEFKDHKGVYAQIYVSKISDFEEAKKKFLLNFVSESSYNAFLKGENTEALLGYGRREISLEIKEKINISKVFSDPQKILKEPSKIYDYLCYGDNHKRQYYTVQEGETIQGVASHFADFTPRHIVLINPDIVFNSNQVLKPGLKLNVTYFTPPLTVVVRKEYILSQPVYPPTPYYLEDQTTFKGKEVILTEEENGQKDVVFEETYINGVLQRDSVVTKLTRRTKEPIQAVIKVGTKQPPDVGTGRFIWPLNNVLLTCRWGCYAGHSGLDLVDQQERHGPIFAADTGVVVEAYFSAGSYGNMVLIDHKNGYQSLYAHMVAPSHLKVGDIVQRGDLLGHLGDTGFAQGVHLHWEIRKNGDRIPPCSIMPCDGMPEIHL